MDICGVELTTCGILEDGHVVRLDLVDDKGKAISLRLPFEQAQAVAMTLPSLLTRALKSLTGSPNARYVFPLDRWFVELSGQRDGLLLTIATADGFQVSFGLPAEAWLGFDARGRSSQAGRRGRRRRRIGLGVGRTQLKPAPFAGVADGAIGRGRRPNN